MSVTKSQRQWRSPLIGVACIGAAALVRHALNPWLGTQLPYATIYGAVAIAAWRCGWRTAVLVAACSFTLHAYAFFPPQFDWPEFSPLFFASAATFALSASLIIVFARAAERNGARAEHGHSALRESEQRFRLMANNAPMLVWVTDTKAQVEFVNKAYCDFFGVTEEQVRGPGGWQPLVHPDDTDSYILSFVKAVDQKAEFRADCRVKNHEGEWRVITSHAAPRFSETGVFVGHVGCSIDITDRKRIEQELVTSHEQLRGATIELERQVTERTASLRDKIGELEAFSYSISHDMRAPLRSMQSFSRMLLEDHAANLPADAQDYLRRIDRNARRLDLLVRDVLAYSQLARTDFKMSWISLGELIPELIATAECNTTGAQVTIASELPRVFGHEALLSQVFANLISNACKFTKPGEKPSVTITAKTGDGWHVIQIQDKGIGIAREHQERIFEIFGRVHGSADYEGTGIGLAIVKKAVQRLSGRIEVQSKIGHGTCFSVFLPATNEAIASRT